MGTKVHFTNNLQAFYTMRDLNEDSDNFLCQYYENKPAGRSLYNGHQLEPSSGYSEYDNEMIKRTMLEHEAIFRKQVYELHRLYRTQKEIMDELIKQPCNLLQGDTSQSNSFSSQIPSKGTSKVFQLAHLPDATTSNKRAPLTITDDMKPTLNFLNDSSVQSGTVLSRKEIALKDGDIQDSNHKELPRRMFDLELPADVYIDCEDGERSGKEIVAESSSVTAVPLDRTKGADPGKRMKLTLCMNEDPNCRKKISKSDIHILNGPFTMNPSDLNEPAREIYFGKAAGSVSAKCLGTNNPLAEYRGLQLPMRSSTSLSGLPTAFLKGRHSEGGANSNHLHRDDDETIREWPFFNNDAGRSVSGMKLFSSDSSKEKFSMPSERIQLNQKPHEILSIDQNKTLAWFKSRLQSGPQYGHSSAASRNSFSDPYLNYANSSSPLLPSWTKPVNDCSHVPLAAPSHQRFPGSATQSHGNPSDKWQYSGDLRSDYRVCMDSNSYLNSFNRGIRLDYNSASQLHAPPLSFGKPNLSGRNDRNAEGCGPQKSHKDVHSNQTLLNGFRDGFTTEKVSESPQNCVDASPSWLKKTPTCNASSLMDLDLSQGYPQLKASCSTTSAVCEKRQETEKSINFFDVQSLPSSSQAKEITTEGNVASEGQSSKKLFGFGIPARNQQSTSIAPHQEKSQTVATKYDGEDELKHSIVGTHIDSGDQVTRSRGLRNHIDLNFDLNLSDSSGEGEMLNAPLQAPALTVASMIDLEAPIVLEEGQQEDVRVTEAAENILWMALDKCSHLDKKNPLFLASFNILHWFAEVASSNAEIVKETSDYGSDTFEQLTLELEETKPEEYRCWSREGPDQKEEDDDDDDDDRKSNIASLLLTKPRRGQQRKRRQKRDFQRDILPGLVSLARHEITEDFQTIGALMKASGLSWKAGGTTRRNGSRGRTNARGRVGRNPRNSVATVEETQVSPPPPQLAVVQPANNSEVEVEVGGKNMIGWGRTTRRCRRQRLPPAANVAPPPLT